MRTKRQKRRYRKTRRGGSLKTRVETNPYFIRSGQDINKFKTEQDLLAEHIRLRRLKKISDLKDFISEQDITGNDYVETAEKRKAFNMEKNREEGIQATLGRKEASNLQRSQAFFQSKIAEAEKRQKAEEPSREEVPEESRKSGLPKAESKDTGPQGQTASEMVDDINRLKYIKIKNIVIGNDVTSYEADKRTIKDIIQFAYSSDYFKGSNIPKILDNFINGCNTISRILNERAEPLKVRGDQYLKVVCPGDSPYKVMRYLRLNRLCPNCKFISFPMSNTVSIGDEDNVNYLNPILPDDLKGTVFMDYFKRGSTYAAILNTYKHKFYEGKISVREYDLLDVSDGIDVTNPDPTFFINIQKYFDVGTLVYLMESEGSNTRCIRKTIMADDNPYTIGVEEFDDFGCVFFVFMACFYNKYKGYFK